MRIFLKDETEKELLLRANGLGVSISNIIRLHLILYSERVVVKKEDLECFKKEGGRFFQIDVQEGLLDKYDKKIRYKYTLSDLLTVHIYKSVNTTIKEWKEIRSNAREEMSFSTYMLNPNIVKKMNDIKKETGLTLTTIINYSSFLKVGNKKASPLNDEKKVKQGFQIKNNTLECLEKQSDIENIKVGHLLELKIKKFARILEKKE